MCGYIWWCNMVSLIFLVILIAWIPDISGGRECGFPGTPRNGSLVESAGLLYQIGENVTYECQMSFVLFGPNYRTCQENGTWSGTVPECRENVAMGKSSLQSSTLWNYNPELAVDSDPDTCSFTPRSSEQRWWQVHLGDALNVQAVAISITPGAFQKFTIFIIELLEGNKAMYKPCSKFEGKFETQKAVFLCNDGLGHPGQFVYIRDDREEQEYFGLCEVEVFEYRTKESTGSTCTCQVQALPVNSQLTICQHEIARNYLQLGSKNLKNYETLCGDPEQPLSSRFNRTSSHEVEYSCVKGYKMESGDPKRTCQANGIWSGMPPRCTEVVCGDPLSVKDGFIEVSNFKGKYVFGSLATYHCNPGYILWGNASRLCTEVGTWTGLRPQCKPITCGQPPEVTNTRFHLMNGTTSWQSLAKYTCKPGHSMVYEKRNLSEIIVICTESGIWQPISFQCVFDPTAVNLKDGASFGWATFDEDGAMNTGTMVTLGALGTLICLVLIIVIAFFSHRRLSDETQSRKVSRSSTNQLIADVANGLAAHIDGPDPPNLPLGGHSSLHMRGQNGGTCSSMSSGSPMAVTALATSPCSPFHNCYADVQAKPPTASNNTSHNTSHMTSFRPPIGHTSLPLPPNTNNNSDCGRSAGDGGSLVEEANYATLKNLTDEDLELMEDEDSHYALVRQPDGKADEPEYSSLSEALHAPSDDGGYESLQHRTQPIYVGIDSPEVQEKVYRTLRHHVVVPPPNLSSLPRSLSSIEAGASTASTMASPRMTGLIGINGFSRTPSLQRRKKEQATADLYARVDRSKKKRSLEDNNGSPPGHIEVSPLTSPTTDSSSINSNRTTHNHSATPASTVIRVNPVSTASPNRRPTTLYPSLSRKSSTGSSNKEPLYATIGSKRPLPTASTQFADV